MDRVVSATEARIHFGELMRRVVEGGEAVVVERGGRPHVVVMSVAEHDRLLRGQEQREDWKQLVNKARAQIQVELGDRQLPPPEDILRQIREERDAQLSAMH